MKQFFRDYFTFNKRERNGVFVLLSIIVVLVLYLNISTNFIRSEPVDFTKFQHDVALFNENLKASVDSSEKTPEKYSSSAPTEKRVAHEDERFNFNPNNLSENDFTFVIDKKVAKLINQQKSLFL